MNFLQKLYNQGEKSDRENQKDLKQESWKKSRIKTLPFNAVDTLVATPVSFSKNFEKVASFMKTLLV